MMTIQEIRQLNDKDLLQEISNSKHELKKMRLDLINGSSKDSHNIKLLRKQIAQMQTIKTEGVKTTKVGTKAKSK